MRSLAAVYDWLGAARPEEEKQQPLEPPDYRLRALPREDIHLYVKPIDNTNVVRVVDKKDWMANIWVAGLTLVGSLLVSALAGPACYGMLASRHVEYLREEHSKLQAQVLELRAQESRLLNPKNVMEWAGERFVAPTAEQVIYPPPPKETVARLGGAASDAH
jgi:hypothetical protein